MAGLFGLENSNHDFNQPQSWGKNIFTNAIPVALAQYLHLEHGEKVIQIESAMNEDNLPTTRQSLVDWSTILQSDPRDCKFLFEEPYRGFEEFAEQTIEKSDVVVQDPSGNHRRALEIKLTAVPDNATKNRPWGDQSCEIVVRPPTIEQLAYSVCESFGPSGRHDLNRLIISELGTPMQFDWSNKSFMKRQLPKVLALMAKLIEEKRDAQQPLVLNVIWRTKGTTPVLNSECFEVFVWTNFAFLQLFVDQSAKLEGRDITRPQRSLIWLSKMLFDYSAQGRLDRVGTFRTITYDNQTDKAGAFNGLVTSKYLKGPFLSNPRVKASELSGKIILGDGTAYLAPERRLDAAAYIELIRNNPGIN